MAVYAMDVALNQGDLRPPVHCRQAGFSALSGSEAYERMPRASASLGAE